MSFKRENYRLGRAAGDKDLLESDSVRAIESELSNNLSYWQDEAGAALRNIDFTFGPRQHLRWMTPFWLLIRFLNRVVPAHRRMWPGYVAARLGTRDPRQPWGWKDPRNTVSMPLWLAVFPDSRVVFIHKADRDGPSKSSSGAWFRDSANASEVERYQTALADLECGGIFEVSFEEATTKVDRFNDLLRWLGMPELTERQFRGLLRVTRFEG